VSKAGLGAFVVVCFVWTKRWKVNILSTFLSRLAMYCDSLFMYSNLPLITVDGSDCTIVRDFAHAISVIAIVVGILLS
jgi:hypothetical protein